MVEKNPHADREKDVVPPSNFIHDIIDEDLEKGTYSQVVTRFPPEPNGYLHIGHAKSIVLNFGLARAYGGRCHLRFDDTNPLTEDVEYVQSIQNDVRWLGYDWGEHLYFASNYFERMFERAVHLIKKGRAYVDSLSQEEIREMRGTLTEVGTESPYRTRTVEENLDLFERMRAGEFEDGAHVLRAKIDMSAANMLMRDPLLYRIRHATHHSTGDTWCIYPMYDFAHCLEDAFEAVTHSICTLEFENNRELYDWLIRETDVETRPKQIEFARLSLTYTIMSKRKLLKLVQDKDVSGWDDPRMPTIAGLRRAGVPPEAVRDFVLRIGVTRTNSRTDPAMLDNCIRAALNPVAPRVMAVLDPLEVELHGLGDDETLLD
ncbi:MAG: glutamine--tRNA ligase, partial [Bradymonadaceae bacterium]